MLKNLSFAHKIALISLLATLAFALIYAVSWRTSKQNSELLETIENGYYSSLKLSRDLYKDLGVLQQTFQDAAAMGDKDLLADAKKIAAEMKSKISAGRNNPVVDVAEIDKFSSGFSGYFNFVLLTTESLIDETGGNTIYDDVREGAVRWTALQESLDKWIKRDQQAVTTDFAMAQRLQEKASRNMALVIVVSIGLMIALSILIIRTTSRSVSMAVMGMGAIAKGDLSQRLTAISGDEMGVMVTRVGEVSDTIGNLAGEVSELIEAVRAGRLSVRGDSGKFQGAYAELIGNVNELIDAFVEPIEVTANYVERIAAGDIPPLITATYHGEFNQIKENVNALVTALDQLTGQIGDITSAAQSGDMKKRGSTEGYSGVWQEVVVGINDTLDAVTDPIREVSRVMSAMAEGDLTVTIDSTFEGDFAQLMNDTGSTLSKLTDVIGKIQDSSDLVSSAANELSVGNQSLSKRTESQVSSLQRTAETMDMMTTTVRQNAENATQANSMAAQARGKAENGGEVVASAVHAMKEIDGSSKRISEIIGVIDEIAFQTNLLALNASVEAARAGEQGRGFAVVASEVRNLAGRSAVAAKEINELIQDSGQKVAEGSRLVDESGRTLEEIVEAIKNVSVVVGEIAEASQSQAAGIDEVSNAVRNMDQMNQENAALVEEATASSASMGDEAHNLTEMMSFFKVNGGRAVPIVDNSGEWNERSPLDRTGS